MDRDTEQSQTPLDAPDDQAAPTEALETASPPAREPADNGLMNRFLRGVGSLFQSGDASDEAAQEQAPAPEPAPPQPTPEPERVTMTQEEFRRAVQSAKDRELVQERRTFAASQADAGDLGPIRQLAQKGDRWAEHQLAERGDTWFLGEERERQLKEEAAREADPVPAIATSFDQTVIWPLLAALSEAEEKRIVGTGIVGMAGRRAAVEDAIGVVRREAVTQALSDEKFVASLLKSEAFRQALTKVPAANKQFRAYFRGDTVEPDLVPAAGRGRRRENDFMNDLLRYGTGATADDDE